MLKSRIKRISDALFSVHHLAIFFIAVWVGMAFMVGEALGLIQPDYKRLLFVMILAYWVGVVFELGIRGPRRKHR